MNHFLALLFVSLCVSTVFTLITKERPDERIRYFLTLMGYMVLGSLAGAWVMSFLPW